MTVTGPASSSPSLLDWLEQRRIPAIVYFTHSAGVDASVEALRRETRIEQVVAA